MGRHDGELTLRRVVVGIDAEGRSTVAEDAVVAPMARPGGTVLQELWRSSALPVRRTDAADCGEADPSVPRRGAVVRAYTLPPDAEDFDPREDLHESDSLYLITVLDGTADFVVETGSVSLTVGDSVVLPAGMHTLCNRSDAPATVLYTAFHLVDEV